MEGDVELQPRRAPPIPRLSSMEGGGTSWRGQLPAEGQSLAPSQHRARRVSALEGGTSLNTSGSSRASNQKMGVIGPPPPEVEVASVIEWECAGARGGTGADGSGGLTLTPGRSPLVHTWPCAQLMGEKTSWAGSQVLLQLPGIDWKPWLQPNSPFRAAREVTDEGKPVGGQTFKHTVGFSALFGLTGRLEPRIDSNHGQLLMVSLRGRQRRAPRSNPATG